MVKTNLKKYEEVILTIEPTVDEKWLYKCSKISQRIPQKH